MNRRLGGDLGVSVGTPTGSNVLLAARELVLGSVLDSYNRLQPYLLAVFDSAPARA